QNRSLSTRERRTYHLMMPRLQRLSLRAWSSIGSSDLNLRTDTTRWFEVYDHAIRPSQRHQPHNCFPMVLVATGEVGSSRFEMNAALGQVSFERLANSIRSSCVYCDSAQLDSRSERFPGGWSGSCGH